MQWALSKRPSLYEEVQGFASGLNCFLALKIE